MIEELESELAFAVLDNMLLPRRILLELVFNFSLELLIEASLLKGRLATLPASADDMRLPAPVAEAAAPLFVGLRAEEGILRGGEPSVVDGLCPRPLSLVISVGWTRNKEE